MKQRAITGVVFVLVTLGCVVFSAYSFLLFFLVVQWFCSKELVALLHKDARHLLGTFLGMLGSLWLCTLLHFQLHAEGLWALALIVVFPLFTAVFQAGSFNQHLARWGSQLLVVHFPIWSLIALAFIEGAYHWEPILFLLGIIWIHDTFAYLVGRWLGKHKLAPSISPGKTIEGSLGGLLFGTAIALLLHNWMKLDGWWLVAYSLVVLVCAAIGDLIASKFKREAGVKDTGKVLPGHGGMYDRFDALLGAAVPALALLAWWWR